MAGGAHWWTRNLTLHYDRMMLILDRTPLARGLVRKKVEVVNYPTGVSRFSSTGRLLGFKVFDKIQTVQPGAIVDNKRLSAVLEAGQGAAGCLPGASAARAYCAAATAEQPRGARSAVKGAAATPPCRRGCGLRQRSGSRADRHGGSLVFPV